MQAPPLGPIETDGVVLSGPPVDSARPPSRRAELPDLGPTHNLRDGVAVMEGRIAEEAGSPGAALGGGVAPGNQSQPPLQRLRVSLVLARLPDEDHGELCS